MFLASPSFPSTGLLPPFLPHNHHLHPSDLLPLPPTHPLHSLPLPSSSSSSPDFLLKHPSDNSTLSSLLFPPPFTFPSAPSSATPSSPSSAPTALQNCSGCGCLILDPQLIRLSPNRFLHEHCAVCCICTSPLLSRQLSTSPKGKCYERDGRLFCPSHYFEEFVPKANCTGCKSSIRPDELAFKLKGIIYHLHCLRCIRCKKKLGRDDRVVMTEERKQRGVQCYEHVTPRGKEAQIDHGQMAEKDREEGQMVERDKMPNWPWTRTNGSGMVDNWPGVSGMLECPQQHNPWNKLSQSMAVPTTSTAMAPIVTDPMPMDNHKKILPTPSTPSGIGNDQNRAEGMLVMTEKYPAEERKTISSRLGASAGPKLPDAPAPMISYRSSPPPDSSSSSSCSSFASCSFLSSLAPHPTNASGHPSPRLPSSTNSTTFLLLAPAHPSSLPPPIHQSPNPLISPPNSLPTQSLDNSPNRDNNNTVESTTAIKLSEANKKTVGRSWEKEEKEEPKRRRRNKNKLRGEKSGGKGGDETQSAKGKHTNTPAPVPQYPFEMYTVGEQFSRQEEDEQQKAQGNKRRGPRTTINQQQLDILNRIFATTPKPSKHARAKLALDAGLSMRVIQVWFQNRRSKERRLKHLCNFLRHCEGQQQQRAAGSTSIMVVEEMEEDEEEEEDDDPDE